MRCSSAPTCLQTQQTNAIKFPFTVYVGWSNIGLPNLQGHPLILVNLYICQHHHIYIGEYPDVPRYLRVYDIPSCMISQLLLYDVPGLIWYPTQLLLYDIYACLCVLYWDILWYPTSMHVCIICQGVWYSRSCMISQLLLHDIYVYCMFVCNDIWGCMISQPTQLLLYDIYVCVCVLYLRVYDIFVFLCV